MAEAENLQEDGSGTKNHFDRRAGGGETSQEKKKKEE